MSAFSWLRISGMGSSPASVTIGAFVFGAVLSVGGRTTVGRRRKRRSNPTATVTTTIGTKTSMRAGYQ
jgi:hypothetical protein